MTINIPLKAVAFVLYTLALLGGAFGISYAVFEWRHDEAAVEIQPQSEQDDAPTLAERNAERELQLCEAALEAASNASRDGGLPTLLQLEIQERLDAYCFFEE